MIIYLISNSKTPPKKVMGCSCLKSNLVIKSKVIPQENEFSNDNIINQSSNHQNRQTNQQVQVTNSQNRNEFNQNIISNQPINNQNSSNNFILNLNNPENEVNNINNNISNRDVNTVSRYPAFSGFTNFEPYLISKNDPNFNYPELPNEYLGHGLKRMKGYISHITLEKLQKVRDDFWTSRIEGDNEIWELLHAICNDQTLSDEDIMEMLRAGGIVPYKDCINVVYDSKGAIYEIPNYCINDPSQYNIPEIEYTKEKPNEKKLSIFIRFFTHQFSIKLSNWISIGELKKLIIKEEEKYNNLGEEQIRLFFGGKELSDDKEVWFYDIELESIIQMLVREKQLEKTCISKNIEVKEDKVKGKDELLSEKGNGLTEKNNLEEKEKIPNDVDKKETDLDKKENVDSNRNEIQCSEKVEQI